MSEESNNIAVLHKNYDEWHSSKGCANVWLDMLADHVEWKSLGSGNDNLGFTKTRITKEKVIDYFDDLAAEWSMNHFKVEEMVAQGSRVVVICNTSWTNKKTNKCFTLQKVDIWTMKDGKATSFTDFFDSQPLIEASKA